MKLSLFTGCILWHPNAEQAKNGGQSKVLVDPITILAENTEHAKIQLVLRTPKEHSENTGQLEYLVRVF